MRKAALLYNPDSGGSKRRQGELQSALAILRGGGVEAELFPTESKRHAGEVARQVIASDYDTIFACGGDGTIHNIAQVLATLPVALGILPIGTANALAHDLEIPINVTGAAQAALTASPRRVALGRVSCLNLEGQPRTRYFVVAAGIGVDAHLFYKLHSSDKQRLGMTAYYSKAWHLWFTYPMPRFQVDCIDSVDGTIRQVDVTELLAVRIRQFGGVVKELAPGASLYRDDARLVLCRTASRLAYLAYVTRSLLGMSWAIPGIDLVHSAKASCDYWPPEPVVKPRRRIYVEADGELIGTLPAEISIVPDALALLVPAAK